MSLKNALFFKEIKQYYGRVLRRCGCGVNRQLRAKRRFVGVVDAGEVLQLTCACFLVEALGVALLAGLDWRVEVNFEERQLSGDMKGADKVPILAVGTDKTGHGN